MEKNFTATCAANLKFCGFLKKALPSREEPDISSSIVNSEARFHLLYIHVHYAGNISPKHGSALNTHSNDFIRRYI